MNKLLTYGTNPWADTNQHVAVQLSRKEDDDSFYIYPLPGPDSSGIIFLVKDKASAAKFAQTLRMAALSLEQFVENL